jgi:peptide-methionine (S)-S-oxide reductase
MALSSMFGMACDNTAHGATSELPKPQLDLQADKEAKPGEMHTMIVAGGCFWCIEGVFEQLEAVTDATSGYAGGPKETANYEAVCSGKTGHAEAVKVTYDPKKITYGELLRVFFTLHDPTTKDAQGPDHGPQYRSAIFPLNDDQKRVAQAYIKQLTDAKAFHDPITTTIEPIKPEQFYPAEDYHQNYVACNPRQGYIVQVALPKIAKVRAKFKDEIKGAEKPATQPASK